MKTVKIILILCTVILQSCTNNTVVVSEKIEMKIDGNTTDFSYNINARLIPIPPQTGMSDYFSISSEDNLANTFTISRIFPVIGTTTLPVTGSFPTPESYFITAFGLDISDGNSGNNLNYTITKFGDVNEQIKATISGTYYDTSNVQHTLLITIDVNRNQ